MAQQKNETATEGQAAFEEGLMGSQRNAPNKANSLGQISATFVCGETERRPCVNVTGAPVTD